DPARPVVAAIGGRVVGAAGRGTDDGQVAHVCGHVVVHGDAGGVDTVAFHQGDGVAEDVARPGLAAVLVQHRLGRGRQIGMEDVGLVAGGAGGAVRAHAVVGHFADV